MLLPKHDVAPRGERRCRRNASRLRSGTPTASGRLRPYPRGGREVGHFPWLASRRFSDHGGPVSRSSTGPPWSLVFPVLPFPSGPFRPSKYLEQRPSQGIPAQLRHRLADQAAQHRKEPWVAGLSHDPDAAHSECRVGMGHQLPDQADAARIPQTIQAQYRIPNHAAVFVTQGAPEHDARPGIVGSPQRFHRIGPHARVGFTQALLYPFVILVAAEEG